MGQVFTVIELLYLKSFPLWSIHILICVFFIQSSCRFKVTDHVTNTNLLSGILFEVTIARLKSPVFFT